MLSDCPGARRAVGCAKGAVQISGSPRERNSTRAHHDGGRGLGAHGAAMYALKGRCSLTAPFAHPTNASVPRCASHPGGRAFLFTVSNSVVSSFPRRVVAPGFCFSLPPPDEG